MKQRDILLIVAVQDILGIGNVICYQRSLLWLLDAVIQSLQVFIQDIFIQEMRPPINKEEASDLGPIGNNANIVDLEEIIHSGSESEEPFDENVERVSENSWDSSIEAP